MLQVVPRGRFLGAPRAFCRGCGGGGISSPRISVSVGPRMCRVSATLSDRETIRLELKGPGDRFGQVKSVGGGLFQSSVVFDCKPGIRYTLEAWAVPGSGASEVDRRVNRRGGVRIAPNSPFYTEVIITPRERS